MHRRNLTLTALVWAAIITVAFLLFPKIYHGAVGWFYLPVIALSVIIAHFFSGSGHSPPELIGWISFGVYTVIYWVVFLVVYVILLEFYLLRQALRHLEEAKTCLTGEKTDSQAALEKIGKALAEVETRRRRHFLLQRCESIDLKDAPHVLAAKAIATDRPSKLAKRVLLKLHSRLAAGSSRLQAQVKLSDLRKDAETLLAKSSAGR